MLFNIERDEGSRIVGYLVPDGFSDTPSVRISDGNQDLLTLPCQEERPALVAAGRHATGLCGFAIDETMVKDLPGQDRLEIYDNETGILIYRRRPAAQIIQKRIFRLETHLFPLWRLDDSIESRFQFFHKGIERHGLETATQLFLMNNASSQYLSGRLVCKTFENNFKDKFACIVLMRDPYAELAERILTLKHARKFGKELLGLRDTMAFEAAISFAETVEPDEKVLRRAFSSMPKMAVVNLANPLTRQLSARTADEAPAKGAIATALDTLSAFTIVGLREHHDLFLEELAHLLGGLNDALPTIAEFAGTVDLAERLKQLPEAEVLIEHDLEIYHQVRSALESAIAEG